MSRSHWFYPSELNTIHHQRPINDLFVQNQNLRSIWTSEYDDWEWKKNARTLKLIENIGNYANKLDLYKGREWAKCKVHDRESDWEFSSAYCHTWNDLWYRHFKGANYCAHLSWNECALQIDGPQPASCVFGCSSNSINNKTT